MTTTTQRMPTRPPTTRTTKEPGKSGTFAQAGLALEDDTGSHRSGPERGTDPYNSSGSFDRRRNWERVGKR
jgi:hypothetical protein